MDKEKYKNKLFSAIDNMTENVSESIKNIARDHAEEVEQVQELFEKSRQKAGELYDLADEYAGQGKEYALAHSVQLRRLAEIRAVEEEWRATIGERDQAMRLYQQLLARELAENQSLVRQNEVLLERYVAITDFLRVPVACRQFLSATNMAEKLASPKFCHVTGKVALQSAKGMLAVGTTAASGAVGLMTLLGTASTGTALHSLAGAAYWNATLAAFGGGSIASGGLGIAGGTVVLGSLVAIPAVAGGYYMADRYTKKAYDEAQRQKQDMIIMQQEARRYYAKCEQQLAVLRRINRGSVIFSAFFDSLMRLSFAADSMQEAERDEFFAILQQAAAALYDYDGLSVISSSGELNTEVENDLARAGKKFQILQEAFYELKAKMSKAYRDLSDELADKSELLEEQELREADIISLQQQAVAEKEAAEAANARLLEDQKNSEEQRLHLQAELKKHRFNEQRLNEEIARQKKAIRKNEHELQKKKEALEVLQNDKERLAGLYDEIRRQQEEDFLQEREAYRKLCDEIELQFWRFGKEEKAALASGEYFFGLNKEARLDHSAIAICYGKALEGIIEQVRKQRDIPLPDGAKEMTLGSYCYFGKYFSHVFGKEFMRNLQMIVDIRNDAAHKGCIISNVRIEEMRRLMFVDMCASAGNLLMYLHDELGRLD